MQHDFKADTVDMRVKEKYKNTASLASQFQATDIRNASEFHPFFNIILSSILVNT